MTAGRLTARDARMFWASAVIPSDQFLLYCFDHAGGAAPAADRVADFVAGRAPSVPDLRLRVDPAPLDLEYPAWAPCEVVDVREAVARTWADVPAAVARMFARQLDATVAPWRLHVLPRVAGAPRCAGEATVVVLQIAHCLADGRGTAAIARELFGADEPGAVIRPSAPPSPALRAARGVAGFPVGLARTVVRGLQVAPARAELGRLTEAGELPPPVPGCPPTVLNSRPDASRDVRMLVFDRDAVAAGTSVTAGALTAVSLAVERYLRGRREPVPESLCAEVMVARPRREGERNSFGNVSVPLLPGVPAVERRARVGRALAAARDRAASPLWRTVGAPDEVVPAILAHHGLRSFDPAVRPEAMAGATVLSSVYRGPADLRLLGGRSVFTAGFPGLSPAMGLTHGVHGLGRTVTLSVTSSRTAVPDPDRYAALLAECVGGQGY